MRLALFAVAIIVAGCGSDLSRDQACADLATARCGELMTCSAPDLARRWPDIATCEAREKLACTDALTAPQTAATPTTDKACADALAGQACDAFLTAVEPPAACLPQHGPRTNGAACAFSAECASGFCSVAADGLCGTCGDMPAAGASCATSGCGPTLTCVASTQLCQAPGGPAAACSKDLPCLAGLACVGATTTAMGSCMAEAASVGATCDPKRMTGPDCSAAAGLTCDTQSLQCVTQPVVAANQPCGLIGTTRTACSGGATCSIPQGETMGVCVAPAPDGGACNAGGAPDCLTPAKCVGGTCQLPGSMTCG